MLKLFKNNFKKTNDCIILATPLIIFLSILSWYFVYAKDSVDSIAKLILSIITMLIMASGFLAAWVYMAKKTIQMSNKIFVFDKDRIDALWNLILFLPKGIGRLFLPMFGVISLSLILFGVYITGTTYFVSKHIGTIDINSIHADNLILSSNELLNEVNSLPRETIITIVCLYALLLAGFVILSFLGILWIPEIVYAEKNPFKALIFSIRKIIITFPKTLVLFIYINFLSVILSILNTLLMVYPIAYFLVLILFYYFIVYMVVLLFTYYEETFIKESK